MINNSDSIKQTSPRWREFIYPFICSNLLKGNVVFSRYDWRQSDNGGKIARLAIDIIVAEFWVAGVIDFAASRRKTI